MEPARSASFALFPQLPVELRLTIWRLCLPRRALELDTIRGDLVFSGDRYCMREERVIACNTNLPVLASVNRESRSVALDSYRMLPDPPTESSWDASVQLRYQWYDRHLTTYVHLSWMIDSEEEDPSSGNPLKYALWAANYTKIPAAISSDLISDLVHRSAEQQAQFWTPTELRSLLRQRLSWTVTVWEPIIIHLTPEAAAETDLFGLLGDAPVQIVPLDDAALVSRYMALGAAGHCSSDLALLPPRLEKDVNFLRENVAKIFAGEEDIPNFRPAFMFRFSAQKDCYDM
jgi:hypothetical protein